LAAKIFWEGSFEILDRDYKIEHISEQRAKFRGDRLTELEDLPRKIKKRLEIWGNA